MHQPCYKKPTSNTYLLPWVRLHGVKDYYGMARLLERFDKVKATFNFSGILLEQLIDYAQNGACDYYGQLSVKNPKYLSKKEKDFIIDRFFSLNFDRHILRLSVEIIPENLIVEKIFLPSGFEGNSVVKRGQFFPYLFMLPGCE